MAQSTLTLTVLSQPQDTRRLTKAPDGAFPVANAPAGNAGAQDTAVAPMA